MYIMIFTFTYTEEESDQLIREVQHADNRGNVPLSEQEAEILRDQVCASVPARGSNLFLFCGLDITVLLI